MSKNLIKIEEISQFLQSEAWNKFQVSCGQSTIKAGNFYFIKKPLGGRLNYVYGSKVSDFPEDRILSQIVDRATLFVRFEPLFSPTKINQHLVKTIDVQPSQTTILDLQLSPDDLLSGMHPKTRYNIRLAEKKGVVIKADQSRIEDFLNLLKITTDRDNFRAHPDDYYRHLAKFDSGLIKLFVAEWQGQVIAGGLFCFYGNTVTYLHGGSANEFRNVMAPYLLQWTVIKRAQELGYKYYDFYGISEQKWPGVTRFKLGFGGQIINYPGTWDYIVRPFLYKIYQIIRKLRRAL